MNKKTISNLWEEIFYDYDILNEINKLMIQYKLELNNKTRIYKIDEG